MSASYINETKNEVTNILGSINFSLIETKFAVQPCSDLERDAEFPLLSWGL